MAIGNKLRSRSPVRLHFHLSLAILKGKGGGALGVVYIDAVFVLNTLMDYLLLLSTARLSGIGLVRWRYWLGAVLGGVYAVAVFLPGLGWLSAWTGKGLCAVVMVSVAFGGQPLLLRLGLVFCALSCAMAGAVLGLALLLGNAMPMAQGVFYTDISPQVLLVCAVACYGLVRMVFFAAARHGVQGQLLPVVIHLQGRRVELVALHDTGNALRDGVTGQGVLVVSAQAVEGLWPWTAAPWLTGAMLRNPIALMPTLSAHAPQLRLRLIPYQAVGVNGGFLLGVVCDGATIAGRNYPQLLLALSPTSLGSGYSALWGERGG